MSQSFIESILDEAESDVKTCRQLLETLIDAATQFDAATDWNSMTRATDLRKDVKNAAINLVAANNVLKILFAMYHNKRARLNSHSRKSEANKGGRKSRRIKYIKRKKQIDESKAT
jgi:hypothetical protein